MIPSALRKLNSGYRLLLEEPLIRVAVWALILRPLRLQRFHSFGAKSFIHKPDWIYGPHKIAIGSGTMVFHHAWLSVERPAWQHIDPVLRIGDGVVIRGHAVISATAGVVIEDHVTLGGYCSVIDSDHVHTDIEQSVVFNPSVAAPIRIGRGTWLGDRVTVLRGAQIGCRCVIGAGAIVRGVIPDYSIAVGAPARVVGSTISDDPEIDAARPMPS